MRYEFYGRKIQYTGKTLWEILGNLKNFGVGRLVRRSIAVKYKNPSFLKINKVQPLPPPKSQFDNRKVMVWVDEYFNGRKVGENQLWKANYHPLYHLIPKTEEEELYKKLQECSKTLSKRQIYNYWYWPPLYKKLWEASAAKDPNVPPLPKLETEHKPYPEGEIVYIDDVKKPPECELYKTSATVEEKLKQIVHLQRIINAKTAEQE